MVDTYNCTTGGMEEVPDGKGDYVTFGDYDALAAELAERKGYISKLEARTDKALTEHAAAFIENQYRISALEAALAYWMPDEDLCPDDCKHRWDEHIELLPPAADRIGAALARATAETKGDAGV